MKSLASFRRGLPFIAQCALTLFGLAGLYAFPPASGRILLLPLTEEARRSLASVAVAHGARLVAQGSWRGSLLVEGRRDMLAQALVLRGVIPVSTQMGGCGAIAS